MWLARIKDSTSQFADVISKTLDVDVLIVDHNLKTVSNTFRYFDKFTLIRKVSLIGQVISTGEVLAVDDKSNVSACKNCIDFYECEMAGFIGVPIKYKGLVVGAIALIFPKQRIAQAFQQVRTSIEFLESMADLLASKLQNADDYNTLNVIKREREVLMDSIADAIVSTDDIGYISYYNKQFAKYFHLEKSCEGEFIQDIVPHKIIGDFLEKQLEVKNKLMFLDFKKGSFYGFASCNNISINGNCNGMLFTFKPISNVNAELNSVKVEAVASFRWAEKRLFSDTLTDEAKRLAVTNKPVLICGEYGTGADILANSIHNFS
ncbi:MAG: GAF domain-containing protein, partial [Angelakisella sp.]